MTLWNPSLPLDRTSYSNKRIATVKNRVKRRDQSDAVASRASFISRNFPSNRTARNERSETETARIRVLNVTNQNKFLGSKFPQKTFDLTTVASRWLG